MATAGYISKFYVTTTLTNPTSSDLVGGVQSASWAPTRAELDTGILGESYASGILGKTSNKPTLTTLFIPSDTGQSRLIAAFASGATVYLHADLLASGTAQRVGIKVSGYPLKTDQAGLVVADFTFLSCTAMDTSTVS